jgi:hypothetical protein
VENIEYVKLVFSFYLVIRHTQVRVRQTFV